LLHGAIPIFVDIREHTLNLDRGRDSTAAMLSAAGNISLKFTADGASPKSSFNLFPTGGIFK